MASDVAQVEAPRKHHRSATTPDSGFGDGESDVKSNRHKRHREKVDDEVDCDGVSNETDGSARDSWSGYLTDGAHPVPGPPNARDDDEDLEEGEIIDDEGEFSQNPVHDTEVALMAIESNVIGGIANVTLGSDASGKDQSEVCALHKSSSWEKSCYFSVNVAGAKTDVSDCKTSFPDSAPDKYRTSGNSPYSGSYEDDWFDSRDHLRDRSHSTFQEDDAPLKGRKHSEWDSSYYSGRYSGDYDSDDRKVSSLEKSWRHGSIDIARDAERQRGGSHSRYNNRDDRHHSRDRTRDRGVRREIEPGRKREEQERRVDRDCDKDRKRSYQEWSIDWDSERDSRREKQKDHRKDKEIDGVRREKERDQNGDSKRDKDRKTESRRDRSRYGMLDKDQRSGKEDDRSGDEKINKDKREDKKRDRDYDGEKQSRRTRGRETERENLEDLSRERSHRSNWEISEDRKWAEHRDARNVNKHEIYEDRGKSVTVSMESTKDPQTIRDEDEQGDSEENFSFVVPDQEEEHLKKIREESRRLRQAILEKHKNQQQLQKQKDGEPQVANMVEGRTISSSDLCGGNPEEVADGGEDCAVEISFSVRKSPLRNGTTATKKASGERGLGEGTPKSERSDDAFRDEIFGDSPAGTWKTDESGGLLVEKSSLSDNWDDAEGYYCYTLGEVLDGRYQVIAAHGKGVFSTVVRAKDIHAGIDEPKEVAVKILRNREAMYKAGIEELGILKKLVGADPDDKRHCVRLLSSFKFRNHLCLVFESLNMNLREVLKKFGRNIGLRLTAVRAYAKQLFIALKHLRNCGVLHCDIKPDNMLVNEAKNMLKLCDFGNAMFSGKNEITPYLVSRFYRAPEIILGLSYDHPMDIWSVGCCLYELYTGKVLFPGPTNNDMLRLHMELKGPFPKKMLKKGAFMDQHFDEDLNFIATEEDPVTKRTIKRVILNIKPKDIGSIIKGSSDEDPKILANFKDLLDKIFVLDPDKRMSVQQALSHPFVTGK